MASNYQQYQKYYKKYQKLYYWKKVLEDPEYNKKRWIKAKVSKVSQKLELNKDQERERDIKQKAVKSVKEK